MDSYELLGQLLSSQFLVMECTLTMLSSHQWQEQLSVLYLYHLHFKHYLIP